jgi:hypothetical protein
LAHNAGADGTPAHETEIDRIFRETTHTVFWKLLRLSQFYLDKPIAKKDIDTIVNVKLPSGKVIKVYGNKAKMTTRAQLEINYDSKENIGVSDETKLKPIGRVDESLVRRRRTDVGPLFRAEEGKGPGRGYYPSDVERPGPGLPPAAGRGEEQPPPRRAEKALPEGVAIQPEGKKRPGEVEFVEEGLTPPEEKGVPFKPGELYQPGPGEEAQKILPIEAPGPLFGTTREPQPTTQAIGFPRPTNEEIVKRVYELTSGENMPRAWSGDTPEQIEDNRQNLAVHAIQKFDPAKGNLDQFINGRKKYFRRGRHELPGPTSEQRIREKTTGGIPISEETGVEVDVSEAMSVFAGEAGPKGKIELDYPDMGPGGKEEILGAQEAVLDQIFRSVARALAGKNEKIFKRALDSLNSRILLDNPESFESIGKRHGVTGEIVRRDFNEMLEAMSQDKRVEEIRNRLNKKLKYAHSGIPVFTEEQLRDMSKWLKKWFSSYRGANAIIDRQNDERLNSPIAEIFNATLDVAKFKKWLSEQPDGTNLFVYQLFVGGLSGGGYSDILDSNLPQDIKEVLLRLRRQIDTLSTILILYGAPPSSTFEKILGNLGQYIVHKYRLYEDKHWNPTPAQRAGFKAAMMRDWNLTEDEADKFIDAELAYAKTIRRTGQEAARTKRIDTTHYIKLKDLSPEWREFAGEIEYLPWLILRTVTKLSAMAYNAKFLSFIADYFPPPTFWTMDEREAVSKGWQHYKIPDHYSYGKLRNAYVSPEIHQYLKRELRYDMHGWERAIEKAITIPFKINKTVLSIPTHARNWLTNWQLTALVHNSIFNPLNWKWYKEALIVFMSKTRTHRMKWTELLKHGVTEVEFYGSEIPKIYSSIMRFDDQNWIEKIWDYAIKMPIDKLGRLYNFEDAWFRIAAYLKMTAAEADGGLGMTPEEAVKEINAGLQNYRKMPLSIDFIRRLGVFGPFVSWQANIIKIAGNQARLGVEEMGNPEKRGRGLKRLLILAGILASGHILSEISKKTAGVDEDDIEQLESYYPDYRRNGTFIYFRMKPGGKLKLFDWSYISPFGTVDRMLNATIGRAIQGKPVDIKSLHDASDFFVMPILDVITILKGRDPAFGTEYDTIAERLMKIFQYVYLPSSSPIPDMEAFMKGDWSPGKNLQPGPLTGPQVKAIIDAYNENPDRFGRIKHLPEEIKNFLTGLRTWDVNPIQLIYQTYRKKKFERDEIIKELMTWAGAHQKAQPWQIEQKREEIQEKAKKLADELMAMKKLVGRLAKSGLLSEEESKLITQER